MSPEAQRIAIAEACGWRFVRGDKTKEWVMEHEDHWRSPASFSRNGQPPANMWFGPDAQVLPDYLNDLNAMHEAEKILRPSQDGDFDWTRWEEYHRRLADRLGSDDVSHATAKEKAQELVRTLGKWDDSK